MGVNRQRSTPPNLEPLVGLLFPNGIWVVVLIPAKRQNFRDPPRRFPCQPCAGTTRLEPLRDGAVRDPESRDPQYTVSTTCTTTTTGS